ncbi:MAG: ComEC/Rec2 family competence protein [Aquificae bacterium]|nr:ComEC/Rec2 family competence protein [Aquificota bacterium]
MNYYFLLTFLSFTTGIIFGSIALPYLQVVILLLLLLPILAPRLTPLFFIGIFLLGSYLSPSIPQIETVKDYIYLNCLSLSPLKEGQRYAYFKCRIFHSEKQQLVGKEGTAFIKERNLPITIGSRVYFFGKVVADREGLRIFAGKGLIKVDNESNPFFLLYKLKETLLKNYSYNTLSQRAFALGNALIFGDKSLLRDERQAFSLAGTSHLLAISGLHIGLIILILLFLLKPLGRWAYYITIVFLVFYPVFVGLQPPVVRASILGILYLVSKVKYLQVNSLDLLFFVGFLILLFSPSSLYSISFQLSFVAVLGLILLKDIWALEVGSKPVKFALSTVLASLVAVLFTTPVVVYYFGMVSFMGILSTPVLVLLLYPYLLLGLVNLFSMFSITPLVKAMDWLGVIFLDINRFFASFQFVNIGFWVSTVSVVAVLSILIGISLLRINNILKLSFGYIILFTFLLLNRAEFNRDTVIVKKGYKQPHMAVITPYGECFYTDRSMEIVLNKSGCMKRIHIDDVYREVFTTNLRYKREKGGYTVELNGKRFFVENKDYTFQP